MNYNLGQTVELDFTTSPAETGTVTVTRPDGTVAPVTSGGAAGAQTALVSVDQVGMWTYVWVSPNTGQNTGTFTVGPRAVLVTLDDVKPHLNILPNRQVNDLELQGFIDAATAVIEDYCGPILPRTVSTPLSATGTTVLAGPVLTLLSVVDPYGNLTLGSGSRSYLLNGPAGVLTTSQTYPPGTAAGTVTYTTGLPSIPPAVRLATCFVVADLWSASQRGSLPAPANNGDPGYNYVPRASSDLPPRAELLLRAYRRPSKVA